MTKFEIQKNDQNQTIFKFLKKTFSSTPLSVIHKWFRKSDIKINGKKIKDPQIILKLNDLVEVYDSNKPIVRDNFKMVENLDLEIVYEDENILIINKEANVEMHSPINESLDDMVKTYCFNQGIYDPQKENSFVVSHVHRLDKLTSGLVIYAKNKMSLDILLKAFKDHELIDKYYLIKVRKQHWTGDFEAKGWIDYDPKMQKSFYSETEKDFYKTAETRFRLIETNEDSLLIEGHLITGRKHQIRATLEYYNLPIINDFRYGGEKINNEKMIYLRAYKIVFGKLPNELEYLSDKVIELNI
ncbi:23S rRNA pseudouridine955/2504/2580 synthase [Williamsoniiplasma luminosum]|uniref:RNA pseudouridylate synthase n=1 Tax=Williamsoniiplasma luminosum TaxID=214888 RepID=A0A2K8NT76_9MOLU|nr:RluA family pseudouridine synthase [Williamsoniiplasma luminosum]ATZ16766.1 23S rRNA pseudouridine955/2504/2580 synthase [Williamsoniiplasma luminosum]